MSRILGLFILIFALALTQWAFRFDLPNSPVDAFLRVMTMLLDFFLLSIAFAMLWKADGIVSRMRTLGTSYPRSVLVFFGLFLAFGTILSAEIGARVYFKHGYTPPYTEQTYWKPRATQRDTVLGTCLPPDTVISHAYIINDSLIYEQFYRIDQFGRRENPQTRPDSSYHRFAMITGCSFAFGYGLSAEQTLSYYLDSLTGMRAYNYGIPGHGTQQTLALLRSRNLKAELSEPNGVLIHLFIDDHIKRLIGSRRLINLWASDFPYYHLDGGELKHQGSFLTGRQLLSRFYRVLSQSSFIALFDIEVPWYVSNSHLELYRAVLNEAKNEFLTLYPDGRFVVVIAPNSTLAPRVRSVLVANNIEVLDLSARLNKDEREYKIHWTEAHPNGNYYLKVAEALKDYLNNQHSTGKPR
jgi:hypothetical protein